MTTETINIKDISIINNRILKIGNGSFVIDKISSYATFEHYVPNDITYQLFVVNDNQFCFDLEHKEDLEKIMADIDHIIANSLH